MHSSNELMRSLVAGTSWWRQMQLVMSLQFRPGPKWIRRADVQDVRRRAVETQRSCGITCGSSRNSWWVRQAKSGHSWPGLHQEGICMAVIAAHKLNDLLSAGESPHQSANASYSPQQDCSDAWWQSCISGTGQRVDFALRGETSRRRAFYQEVKIETAIKARCLF